MVANNSTTDAVADAAKAQANTVAETAKAAARTGEASAKAASDAGKRAVKGAAKTARRTARKGRKTAAARTARKPATARKTKTARPQAQTVRNERNSQMNFNPSMFAGFSAFPGTSAFETLFTQAAERGDDTVKRSRQAAEQLADLYRGNVEAFIEAGRIAATGAQAISKKFAAKNRDGVEQTANAVRSLAEAKSPTEILQLQAEYARSAFDRFVEDSSALTESVVKLAGEAFQPISSRASTNVEKFNDIAA